MNRIILVTGIMLLLAIAFATNCQAAETIAVEFTADWCPYCRKIEPTVAGLISEGFSIRQINVDAKSGEIAGSPKSGKELAGVYGVTTIPAMFVQSFDDSGKATGFQRVPLDDPKAIRLLLFKAGVKQAKK